MVHYALCIKRKDTEMINTIKSWNGKMPLTVSFGMVWFFSLLGMYFLDIFDVYPRNYFSHLLMFACYCFIQHFFLVFLRRFLLLKTIPSLYRVVRFYFITYLLITGLGILFDLSNGDYEHLLYLNSWFIIVCFYKKNIVKNIHFFKENILNPKFWLAVFLLVLLGGIIGFCVAWLGFISLTSLINPRFFNILFSFLSFMVAFLLIVYGVVIQTYIFKWSCHINIDKQNLKKTMKVSFKIASIAGSILYTLYLLFGIMDVI